MSLKIRQIFLSWSKAAKKKDLILVTVVFFLAYCTSTEKSTTRFSTKLQTTKRLRRQLISVENILNPRLPAADATRCAARGRFLL